MLYLRQLITQVPCVWRKKCNVHENYCLNSSEKKISRSSCGTQLGKIILLEAIFVSFTYVRQPVILYCTVITERHEWLLRIRQIHLKKTLTHFEQWLYLKKILGNTVFFVTCFTAFTCCKCLGFFQGFRSSYSRSVALLVNVHKLERISDFSGLELFKNPSLLKFTTEHLTTWKSSGVPSGKQKWWSGESGSDKCVLAQTSSELTSWF